MTEPTEYDFWRCDDCKHVYLESTAQFEVRLQQTTERIYGTDLVMRPVEKLVVCRRCWMKFRGDL